MLGVACLDGCCYLLRLDMLADKQCIDLQQFFLMFSRAADGTTRCHWATDAHCQVVNAIASPCICACTLHAALMLPGMVFFG